MSASPSSDDLAEVVRRERLLLDPTLRASGEDLERLLHPDFLEYGASGRVWERQTIIAALSADAEVAGQAEGFAAVPLGPGVALVTYRISGPSCSLRSSVWVEDASGGWRLRFHQGTRAPDTETGHP